MSTERAVLLVGSPKEPSRSNSHRLGAIVMDGLKDAGWECCVHSLPADLRDPAAMPRLLEDVDAAQVVVLATPLYVDSLPASVIEALQRIVDHRRTADHGRVPRFLPIVQCGFVEPWQNEAVQRMLELFASEARLEQVGRLSLGAAGAVNRSVRRAFRLVIDALREDILVPDEVTKLTRYRILPARVYILINNWMWRRMARRSGIDQPLDYRRYDVDR